MPNLYRIAKDLRRQIPGYDCLTIHGNGMRFVHETHQKDWETVFEADYQTCLMVAILMDQATGDDPSEPRVFLLNAEGKIFNLPPKV